MAKPVFTTRSSMIHKVDYHEKEKTLEIEFRTGQLPISSKKEFNSRYFSGFSLTPRYEGRVFGFYLPLNYNSLTKFNAGVSLRVGPMFIGSGSVLSALIGNSKQADFHFGIRFGGLKKKPKSPKAVAESTEEK